MLYTKKEELGKWAFFNENDELICDFIYDEVRDFSEGFAAVRKGIKWAYINEDGRPICDFIYDEARDFSEGIAAVRIDVKWGYINKNGKEICEIRYDSVGDFQSNLGVVDKEGKRCYLNAKGEEVTVTNFMNEEMIFEGCKSCAIAKHAITNLPGGYLYEDDLINVTIDPEIPIKGFIVIGTQRHVATTTLMTREERIRIEDITNQVK